MLGNIDVTCRPITDWPGEPTKTRERAPFSARWDRTLLLLRDELRHIRAKQIVLELALEEREIRLDGLPRANANPRHPGIILSFESKHGPMRIACDRFRDWKDNLRAIALGLHDLRRLDRYGITKRGEQYRGWRALPGNGAGDQLTRGAAASILAAFSGLPADYIDRAADGWKEAHRIAVKKTHPDGGGDPKDFHAVQAARAVFSDGR